MKNLDVTKYGVQEMDARSMEKTNGGTVLKLIFVEYDSSRPKGERWQWFWEQM